MSKLNWVKEEEIIVDNHISVGAKVNIKDLQYSKRRSINELRWKIYQELIKNLGDHANMEGTFYTKTWYDIDPYTNDICLFGRIESIKTNNVIVKSVLAKPEYSVNKKLSFKDRLRILFKGEL